MATQFELTDTFQGESNYSWVRRWHSLESLTDAKAIKLGKLLAGWTGMRCDKSEYGDMIDMRPRKACQVLFITYSESGYEQGPQVDRHGNIIESDAE